MLHKDWEYVESPENVHAKRGGPEGKRGELNTQDVRLFGKKPGFSAAESCSHILRVKIPPSKRRNFLKILLSFISSAFVVVEFFLPPDEVVFRAAPASLRMR
ncbi:MAG: hypothetical protein KIT39_19890 [Nitrospirales bacterium]|nr:hypothetical protein [Nitrospirales bacterium]